MQGKESNNFYYVFVHRIDDSVPRVTVWHSSAEQRDAKEELSYPIHKHMLEIPILPSDGRNLIK